jgi:hypothetical protein
MRTVVLILMIALLPLRMWAAEGMAIRMAHAQPPAAGMSSMEPMPEDCPMVAESTAGHGSQDDQSSSTAHCLTCHLCAAAACLPEVALQQGPALAGPRDPRSNRYISADLSPDLRPPIS